MLTLGLINSSTELPDYQKVIKDHIPRSYAGQFIPLRQIPTDNQQTVKGKPDDFRKFISGCDAVIIPNIDDSTYSLIVEALKQSKHTLLGNPLALDPDELDQLFKLAEEANVIIKVMQNVIYYGVLETASDYIDNPAYLEVRIDSTEPQSSIFDSMFHAIQPVVYINHSNLKKLHAVSIPINAHHPGMINARVEFDNGCVANITSSKFADTDRFYCRIHQANQDIRIDFLNKKVILLGSDNNLEIRKNDYIWDEIDHFINNIQSKHYHINQSESGYLTYLISRKIMEKISLETLSA